MVRKLVSATVSAALCTLSVAPGVAAAQDHRFTGFDAPQGATATVNLRIPFGGRAERSRPSYGFTLGYGQVMGGPSVDGRTMTRSVNLADIRFNQSGELRNARLAGFDLANLDRDRRMNLTGGGSTTWLIVGVIAGGVAACLLLECFDGNDDDPAT